VGFKTSAVRGVWRHPRRLCSKTVALNQSLIVAMASDADFLLAIDLSSFKALDDFSLLACQSYNLGNDPDWFGSFRGGLYGMYARIDAVVRHFYQVHSWVPVPRFPQDAEYHLASALFAMDSSFECFTFALNALGCAVDAGEFQNITDHRAMKAISPDNIVGATPRPGYARYFPSVQALWLSQRDLIRVVMDQHDVSKHRTSIFRGGKVRMDPPAGLIEALGLKDDPRRIAIAPMEEIILIAEPKKPPATRGPVPVAEQLSFEQVVREWAKLIESTGDEALKDAKATIVLKESGFWQ
jgi:hypothetical protein